MLGYYKSWQLASRAWWGPTAGVCVKSQVRLVKPGSGNGCVEISGGDCMSEGGSLASNSMVR